MSEILIKGMEMPKSCGECRASGTDVCRKWMGKKNLKVRSEDCPLVELPPHGRLGDLDKFKEEVKDCTLQKQLKNGATHIIEVGKMFAEMINEAPTVLEATK